MHICLLEMQTLLSFFFLLRFQNLGRCIQYLYTVRYCPEWPELTGIDRNWRRDGIGWWGYWFFSNPVCTGRYWLVRYRINNLVCSTPTPPSNPPYTIKSHLVAHHHATCAPPCHMHLTPSRVTMIFSNKFFLCKPTNIEALGESAQRSLAIYSDTNCWEPNPLEILSMHA